MAAMSPREFMDEIAVPTVRDFIEDPTQRRGYLACIVAFHLGDYLAPAPRQEDVVYDKMHEELGLPFEALRRMCNAAKHRSSVGKKDVLLMESGSDTARPVSGFGSPWSELRFDDRGGRHIDHEGHQYDMLDLCLIALRAYADLYPVELAGSSLDTIRYNTKTYPKT